MAYIVIAVACCLLAAGTNDCEANTRFGFGTIVTVDHNGEHNRKGNPSFTIQYEFKNLKWSSLYPRESFRIKERTRHGWRVYFLDGQPSTAEEALQVGRTICMSNNDMVCQIATTPGPWPLGQKVDPANAIYRLDLKNAFHASLAKVNRGTIGEFEPRSFGIEVVLNIAGGQVTAATAIISGLRGPSDHRLDPADWSLVDGGVQGQLRCTIDCANHIRYASQDDTPLAIDLQVTTDAELNGSYTGTSAGTERSDSVSGSMLPANEPRTTGRIWLQFDELESSKCHFGVIDLNSGAAGSGNLIYFKGGVTGRIDGGELNLTNDRLHGSCQITASFHGKELQFQADIDSNLYGNHLLLGTYTIDQAELGSKTRALRGGLFAAGQPQIHGAEKELVKALQKKLYPDDPKNK